MKTAIEMAKKAGFMLRAESVAGQDDWWECFDSEIETLVALARADENEACALIADEAEPYKAADLIRKRRKP
jgi:hypothetical protein